MERDDLFARQQQLAVDFAFDRATAGVFDDMVSRSVPFYQEFQRLTAELADDFAQDGTNLYDLGCSTGTTLIEFDERVSADVQLIGLDNSPEMLDRARAKRGERSLRHRYDLRRADLHEDPSLENASVVVLLLTLQFVRPLYRHRLVRSIYQSLVEGGCLLLVEKITLHDSHLNRLFIQHYYDMKRRNGYSEMEIARKREALENVLIPYRAEENHQLLSSEGFRSCAEFFRWCNFAGMVAVK